MRVALVTGSGRGLGRAHALALATDSIIIVNDTGGDSRGASSDPAPAESVVEEIRRRGGAAEADFTDVSEWAAAQALVDRVVSRYGRLDVIVNNAGVSRSGTLGDLHEDDWRRQFAVNTQAPIAIMDAAARHWRSTPRAHRAIINTSSPAGPHPIAPIGVYSASKAAVAAFTMSAAAELAPLGARVNAIAPVARTRLIDHAPNAIRERMQARGGFDPYLPEHGARLVAYLASAECRFTGRLFGCVADRIQLFRPWTAEYEVDNAEHAWDADGLAQALGSLPEQEIVLQISAEGRHAVAYPSDETVAAVGARG